jgi:hypothetical protein
MTLEAAIISVKLPVVSNLHTQSKSEDPNHSFEADEKKRANQGYILAPMHVLAISLYMKLCPQH